MMLMKTMMKIWLVCALLLLVAIDHSVHAVAYIDEDGNVISPDNTTDGPVPEDGDGGGPVPDSGTVDPIVDDATNDGANSTDDVNATNVPTEMPSVMPTMEPTACLEEVEMNVTETVAVNTTVFNNSTNATDIVTTMVNVTVAKNVTQPCTTLSPTESPISISIGFRSSTFEGLITQLLRNMSAVDDESTADDDDVFPTQAFLDVTREYIETFYANSPIVKHTVKITNVQIQIKRLEISNNNVEVSTSATATDKITTYTVLWDLILTYFGDLDDLASKGIVSEEAFVKLPFATEEDRSTYLESLLNSTDFDDSYIGVLPALVDTTLTPSASPSQAPTVPRSDGVASFRPSGSIMLSILPMVVASSMLVVSSFAE